jgi:membrane protease YdiL (CAAX protease family)
MENSQTLLSLLIIAVISILLAITGLKKQPGIGVIGAVVVIALTLLVRADGLDTIGFSHPASWLRTIFGGLVLGTIIQFITIIFIEPFSEKITNTTHDHSIVENVKGNWLSFVQWMLLVWVFVAFLEEGIYRGFLMTEFARIFGSGSIALAANILLTAVVFGMSHGYQSWSGIVSTGIVGAVLGVIFVASDFNIWLALFTHGFIDTTGIALIALEKDKEIRKTIWKP